LTDDELLEAAADEDVDEVDVSVAKVEEVVLVAANIVSLGL
jgi:hypothetical protein